jgi:hypothetical protein
MTVGQQQHSHCGSIWGHAFLHLQGVLPMHQHILTINIPLISAMCAVVSACACCLQNADDTATATDVPEASAHVDEPAPSPAGSAEAHGTPAPMPGSAIGGLTPVLGQTPGAGQYMFRDAADAYSLTVVVIAAALRACALKIGCVVSVAERMAGVATLCIVCWLEAVLTHRVYQHYLSWLLYRHCLAWLLHIITDVATRDCGISRSLFGNARCSVLLHKLRLILVPSPVASSQACALCARLARIVSA